MQKSDLLSILLGLGILLAFVGYQLYLNQLKNSDNTELLEEDIEEEEAKVNIKDWSVQDLKNRPLRQNHFIGLINQAINQSQSDFESLKLDPESQQSSSIKI